MDNNNMLIYMHCMYRYLITFQTLLLISVVFVVDSAVSQERLTDQSELGRRADRMLPNSTLMELENVGHTPHFEAFDQFMNALLPFLSD
jgi:hypothetical protein